jgi:inhibitor of KinA sporulation pathway (predicted exonuclease)
MSKKRMDVLNVIDIEATCWPDGERKQPYNEIIEIGNAQLDMRTFEITEGEAIYVKPTVSRITYYCTQLTGHTPAFIGVQGIRFSDAMDIVRKRLKGPKFLWGSWGDFDRHIFRAQCLRELVRYPFSPTHYNLKAMFSTFIGERKQMSLERALDVLGWTFKGRPHNGQDDTYNIALIAKWLLSSARFGVLHMLNDDVLTAYGQRAPGNPELRGR